MEQRIFHDAFVAAGSVLGGEPKGYGLASLLTAKPHVANLARTLFDDSHALKLAALTRLLALLRRVDASTLTTQAASRALRVHAALSKAGKLTQPGTLGETYAEYLLGSVVRGEFVSAFDLAEVLEERGDRETVKLTIDAVRAVGILDELVLSIFVTRLRGYSVPLADLCTALRDVIEKEAGRA